jgi:hypothetical protein
MALALGAVAACERLTSPRDGSAPRPVAALAPTSTPTIDVDFAAPVAGVKSVSGLLHGLSATTPDSMVAPLRPALWRIGSFEHYAPQRRSGARVVAVLSDFWGYPKYGGGAVKWPYDDWTVWERFVDSLAVAHADKPVVWDVWNEPDIDFFWPQGELAQARFHETYARAYRVLRARLGPNAVVAGPSYSYYDRARMQAFVSYCAAAGCEANVLTWHELWPTHTLSIAEHLADARRSFMAAGEYAGVRVRELHVNETVGEADTHRPGAAVVSFHQLEQGGADAAARACWNDASGELTCFNGSLDGLLTSGGKRRRASWWAYKAYADGVGSRVTTRLSDPRVAGLASSRSGANATPQLLIGSWSPDGGPSSTNVQVQFRNLSRVPALAGRARVRVRVYRIPNGGETALDRLSVALDRTYGVSGDAVAFTIGIGMYEAQLVTIQ